MVQRTRPTSPPWSLTTKLIVGLSAAAVFFIVIGQLQKLLIPLLLASILIYVLHPIVRLLSRSTRLSWRMSVTVFYLAVILLAGLGIFQLSLTVAEQAIDLFLLAENALAELPTLITSFPTILPANFPFQIPEINAEQIAQQLLGVLQPIIGQAGDVVRLVAGTTASGVGWMLFILLLSFFVMLDLEPGSSPSLLRGVPVSYQDDVTRLTQRISQVWRGFLYGQGLLFALTVAISFVLLSVLGVRTALALAVLAGFARFVPYVGPAIVWLLSAIVAYFQDGNYFGMAPLTYALTVVGSEVVLDQLFDNVISPRVLGQVLGVHPAAVLIAAIAALTLLGPVGLVLAAPLLATVTVIGRYVLQKLFDLSYYPPPEPPLNAEATDGATAEPVER